MVQEEAAIAQQPLDRREVGRQVSQPHVLEHADARDLVVEILTRVVTIVLQQHAAARLQAGSADALGGEPELVLGKGDAGGVDPVLLRRVHRERAPAAADVEEALVLLQAQLAANVVELRHLRLLERVGLAAVVGARIHHARVEPERVELVGDVVVVLDRVAIVLLRVPPVGEAGRVE